jgi:hypothetical protein
LSIYSVLGLATRTVLAQAPATSVTNATGAAVAAPVTAHEAPQSLAVDIDAGASGLDSDALRDAIARETGVSVTSAVTSNTTRLLVRANGPHQLRFELVEPGGRRVERAVDLSEVDDGRALDTAALVAATLLEDEASALIASLRSQASPPKKTSPEIAPRLALTPPARLGPCLRPIPGPTRIVGADVVPYVGTSAFEPEGTVRYLSLELAGGHYLGVRGAQLSSFAAFGNDFVCGAQIGAFGAYTHGDVTGATVAGIGTWVEHKLSGVALGAVYVRTEDTDGAIATGFLAAARHVEGVELSATIAWADSLVGVQIAGGAAISARKTAGFQLAPLTLSSDMTGLQMGGVNIAGHAHGAQIGVVNIARTSDASIGLLSIVSEGRTHVDAFVTTDGVASVALQHGSRWVHNYYGASMSVSGENGVVFGPLIGIGVHVPLGRAFIDIDTLGHLLFDSSEGSTPQSLYSERVIYGFPVARGIAFYAGPSYNFLLARTPETQRARSLFGLEGHIYSGDARTRHWPGLVAGLRFF